MTSRNWRTKSNRTGCKMYMMCDKKNNNSVDTYIPNTLTISPFTNIGTFSWTAPQYVTSVDYLIVGGGGGGGAAYDTGSAGGGGGGLALTGSISVTPGTTYSIMVGDGGIGGAGTLISSVRGENNGNDGLHSSFSTIIALGGGKGYKSRAANGSAGLGGSASNNNVAPTGGNGAGNRVGGEDGGGGGGNTSAGGSSNSTPNISRTAGAGLSSNISGSNVTYGAGGVGGRVDQSRSGSNAPTNTGNGGEGATSVSSDYKSGGNGGSGIVILKYYI